MKAGVSEEHTVTMFRVEECAKQEADGKQTLVSFVLVYICFKHVVHYNLYASS
jgi:hypothetical protein